MRNVNYEGIGGIDLDWVESKSKNAFLEEAETNKHWLEGDPQRDKKLKELWAYATGRKDDIEGVVDTGSSDSEPPAE